MKPNQHFLVAVLALTSTVSTMPAAEAQSPARPAPDARVQFTRVSVEPMEKAVAEIEFEALSMRDVAEYLHVQFSPLNFIVAESVANVPVTLRVVNVQFQDVATALEIATDERVRIDPVSDRLIHIREGNVKAPKAEPLMRVFNLSKYLSAKDPRQSTEALEELQEVVELAWKTLTEARRAAGVSPFHGRPDHFNSHFHPGTKLMIVVGSVEYVRVFEEVVGELQGAPRTTISRFHGGGFGGMDAGGGFSGGSRGMRGGLPAGGGSEFGGGDPFGSSGMSSGGGDPFGAPSGGRSRRPRVDSPAGVGDAFDLPASLPGTPPASPAQPSVVAPGLKR